MELLLANMEVVETEFTQTFRDLAEGSMEDLKGHKIPSSAWGFIQCMKHKHLHLQEVLSHQPVRGQVKEGGEGGHDKDVGNAGGKSKVHREELDGSAGIGAC